MYGRRTNPSTPAHSSPANSNSSDPARGHIRLSSNDSASSGFPQSKYNFADTIRVDEEILAVTEKGTTFDSADVLPQASFSEKHGEYQFI